jgi:hypothetical protein
MLVLWKFSVCHARLILVFDGGRGLGRERIGRIMLIRMVRRVVRDVRGVVRELKYLLMRREKTFFSCWGGAAFGRFVFCSNLDEVGSGLG